MVGRAFQLAGDELAAAPADVAHVDRRLRRLAGECRQPAVGDAAADVVVEHDLVENFVVAFGQVAAVEPERRRRESAHRHARVRLAQHVERGAIHAIAVVRHEVAFIDQDEIAPAKSFRRAEDALNAEQR